MAASRIARRYAAALFRVASRRDCVAPVGADLHLVQQTALESADLISLLQAPLVPLDRKRTVVHTLFDSHLSEDLSRQFLDLLVVKGREALLLEIASAYQEIADAAAGIVAVEVRSAKDLTEEQTARLKAKLDRLTGKDTRLERVIDPSLLGGVRVRIGDTILDGSARGYLDQFGERLRSIPPSRFLERGHA